MKGVCKALHSFQSHSKQRRGIMLSFGVINYNLDTYIYNLVGTAFKKPITENSRPKYDGVRGTGRALVDAYTETTVNKNHF